MYFSPAFSRRVPWWLSRLSAQLLISAEVMISCCVSSSPVSGSTLTVHCLLGVFSPILSLPLPHVLCVSQNKLKKFTTTKKRNTDFEGRPIIYLPALSLHFLTYKRGMMVGTASRVAGSIKALGNRSEHYLEHSKCLVNGGCYYVLDC